MLRDGKGPTTIKWKAQRESMGREEGPGWGAWEYLWRIHFDVGQN